MLRPSRLGLALAAAVAMSSLTFGAAYADAPPPPGTADCKKLVDADPDVTGAAEADKPAAISAATAKLCTGVAAGDPTTTTPPATTTSSKPPTNGSNTKRPDGDPNGNGEGRRPGGGRGGNDKWRPGDEKDCRDFDTKKQAQDFYKKSARGGDKDPSRLDRNKNGKACEDEDDDGDDSEAVIPPNVNVNVVIVQSDDDDSEAKVSGSQVKEVPEGSVDTGGY